MAVNSPSRNSGCPLEETSDMATGIPPSTRYSAMRKCCANAAVHSQPRANPARTTPRGLGRRLSVFIGLCPRQWLMPGSTDRTRGADGEGAALGNHSLVNGHIPNDRPVVGVGEEGRGPGTTVGANVVNCAVRV